MQGIILAGGEGMRLGELVDTVPKALIEVDGKPLVDYAIAFLHAIGIKDIVVVGGAHFKEMEDHLKDKNVQLVENTEYKRESLSSLQKALPHVSDTFLQIDVDFIYAWDIAARVKEQLTGSGIKVICTSDEPPEDMVKVKADDSMKVLDMEKDIPDFKYGYIGMFYCHKDFLPTLKEHTESILEKSGPQGAKLWKSLTTIAEKTGSVRVGGIGSFEAVEVDTPEERDQAEEFIKQNQESVNRYFVV